MVTRIYTLFERTPAEYICVRVYIHTGTHTFTQRKDGNTYLYHSLNALTLSVFLYVYTYRDIYIDAEGRWKHIFILLLGSTPATSAAYFHSSKQDSIFGALAFFFEFFLYYSTDALPLLVRPMLIVQKRV